MKFPLARRSAARSGSLINNAQNENEVFLCTNYKIALEIAVLIALRMEKKIAAFSSDDYGGGDGKKKKEHHHQYVIREKVGHMAKKKL